MSTHPLAAMLADAAHGRFPPADGLVEVLPSPGPPCDALIAFSGHFVLAADVDPNEVARRMPSGDFSAPLSPEVLLWLAAALHLEPASHDALLVAIGTGSGAPSWLQRDDDFRHPRVERATRYRTDPGVWIIDRDAGVMIIGRGLCGRWEVGYEVEPEYRGGGLGRRLVGAARDLVPAEEPLWAQVAPGNAASMRSTLAAGFVPVGAEVLFARSY